MVAECHTLQIGSTKVVPEAQSIMPSVCLMLICASMGTESVSAMMQMQMQMQMRILTTYVSVVSRMVEELGEKLKGKAEVVTCMVDRICTGREVTGNDIFVSAEPHVGEVRLAPYTLDYFTLLYLLLKARCRRRCNGFTKDCDASQKKRGP